MAENVVECLEVIQIEQENGDRLFVTLGPREFGFKRLFHKTSIKQIS
jgi:hypothetical protein